MRSVGQSSNVPTDHLLTNYLSYIYLIGIKKIYRLGTNEPTLINFVTHYFFSSRVFIINLRFFKFCSYSPYLGCAYCIFKNWRHLRLTKTRLSWLQRLDARFVSHGCACCTSKNWRPSLFSLLQRSSGLVSCSTLVAGYLSRVSVTVPVSDTNPEYLQPTIESVSL